MTPIARRLTFAEVQELERLQGRMCRGCRTIFAPEDIPTSFGADARTSDGLTKLCIACLAVRDGSSNARIKAGRSVLQADYRALRKNMLIASSRAHLDKYLAHDPPEHAIPLRAMPGYPPTATPATSPASRTKQEDAALTLLYSKLRDAPFTTWEELANLSRSGVPDYLKLGPRSLDLIDEHLKALGLPPLAP